jgi:hypothetical protein
MTRTDSTLDDKAGRLEHLEVLRDRRTADVEMGRDLAGGKLAVGNQLQDLLAPRLGQRS